MKNEIVYPRCHIFNEAFLTKITIFRATQFMSASTQSFISIFAEHIQSRTKKVALRHKQLGIWQEWTWLDLSHLVEKYISALNTFKIESEHDKNPSCLILSTPNVHYFAFSIASQSLGISVHFIESQSEQQQDPKTFHIIQRIQPDFIFIEDLKQLDDMSTLELKPNNEPNNQLNPTLSLNSMIFYLEDQRLNPTKLNHTYSIFDIIKQLDHSEPEHQTSEIIKSLSALNQITELDQQHIAFVFHKIENNQYFNANYHVQDLTEEAKALIETHHLNPDEQALMIQNLANHDHIRYLFAPWLIAGFCLNLAENLATRDQDRQIIAPTLSMGTASSYEVLGQVAQHQLPNPNHWIFKMLPHLRSGYSNTPNQLPHIPRFLEKRFNSLFKQSILASLGFSHVRTALVIDESTSNQISQFYQRLGINLSSWQTQTLWNPHQLDPQQDQAHGFNLFNDHSSSGDSHVIAQHP